MSALDRASGAAARSASGSEYARFCGAVRKLTGVDLDQYRQQQMERRVRALAQRRGAENLTDYYRMLRQSPQEQELFVDRVTINVSQLWRNPEQWERLGDHVLPELAARRSIRAWSAGCSYGAEPCTLAALVREVAPDCRLEIRATDIDAVIIEQAKATMFAEHDARDMPPNMLRRWFDHVDGGWRATREVRRAITFDVEDLLDAGAPAEDFDLVLCRNVVIYLTVELRERAQERLAASLRQGGYLMVGSTERVARARELGLQRVMPFIYRKL